MSTDVIRKVQQAVVFALAITAASVEAETSADTTTDSPPEPAPLHALLDDQRHFFFSLSPDGSKLARVQWSPSGWFLAINDTSTGEILEEIPLRDNVPNHVTWLSPRRILYNSIGRILVTNVDGTDHTVLLNFFDEDTKGKSYRGKLRAWSLKHLLPDDPEHILVQSWNYRMQPAVVKVNIYTGEQEDVVNEPKLDVDSWLVDRDGDVRVGIRFIKDETQILSRENDGAPWTVYDDYSQDGGNTLGHTGKTYLTQRVNLEAFDYDNNHIYMATNRQSDKFKIVKYNLNERRVVEDVYASDTYDVGGAEMDHTVLHFLDSEEKLIGISLAEDKIRTIWFDERFQKYQDDLDKYRPNHTNRILDWSDDGKIILVKSYSDTDPGRYSIFNPEQMKMFTVAENNVELRESKLSPTQIIRFQARDGYELQGYLNLPTYRGDTPSRLVVMPHGGPFARDHWRFDPWVQFFATRGYGVLRVNFRGSTGFGRNHLLAGIRKLDSTMVDDIADGALWAVEHGHADAGEVYIFGHSYGGYAALMSAIRHPDIYQAAVAWSAPTDLVEQLKSHKKNKEYFAYEYWRTVVGDPRKERQTLARISPVNNIKSIGIPVLLFHGQGDETIPVEQAEDFEKALRKAGNPAEVRIIEREGHSFENNNNISYVLEKALRFFESPR